MGGATGCGNMRNWIDLLFRAVRILEWGTQAIK